MRYVEACELQEWHVRVWPKGEPEKVRECPYYCRSWRHPGPCSHWKGAQDFRRVQEAIGKHHAWVYAVLTYPSRSWPNLEALYRAGVEHWSILRKRLTRRYGKLLYIQTWEQHQSGYPHVNVTISNQGLYDFASADWQEARKALEVEAVASGFGYRVWLEPLRDTDAMAGYMCKLARELTGSSAKNQTPIRAPPHFRRLRASQGLLPPVWKNPDITGVMKFCELSVDGNTYVTDEYGEVLGHFPKPRKGADNAFVELTPTPIQEQTYDAHCQPRIAPASQSTAQDDSPFELW